MQKGIAVFDGIEPTVEILDTHLSIDSALTLGQAGLSLSDKRIAEGEVAGIHKASQLLNFENFDMANLN